MTDNDQFTLECLSEPADFRAQLIADVRDGLTAEHKSLPSIYFYDDHGSNLFERITELPEYYLTRAETEILEANSDAIMSAFQPTELMEIGAGFARKTRILLKAMHDAGAGNRYVPIDVSDAALKHAGDALTATFPWLTVRAYVGDFGSDLHRVPRSGHRIVAFLGSTIGNLPPDERSAFLSEVAMTIKEGDALLLGVDLVKDEPTMVAAYDDAQGISAEFNKNILAVINRHLDGDLPLDAFEHETRFNAAGECMEQSLRATRDITSTLAAIDLTVTIAAGESIHTEWSCKFTQEGISAELSAAGLEVRDVLTDTEDRFALVVATK
ncbi:MAG: L-histidine N(alpha)-methyltransferase [Acidimicrobiia bacterium]|nr:MAG: L-histidine N(alpha)-methyltransferase [Acidimicrobiia bacterium]